jgi:hypothetical protein
MSVLICTVEKYNCPLHFIEINCRLGVEGQTAAKQNQGQEYSVPAVAGSGKWLQINFKDHSIPPERAIISLEQGTCRDRGHATNSSIVSIDNDQYMQHK